MTVFLNVTDAIGRSSNHGITRTERQLAKSLMNRPEVEFAVFRNGRCWRIERDDVSRLIARTEPEQRPVVERLGIDHPPTSKKRSTWIAQRLRAGWRESADFPAGPRLSSLDVASGDAFVSVGLDWVHDVVAEAERLVYGRGVRYFGFCYDMIPADHPEWLFPPDPAGFLEHFGRVTRVATAVLAISESTRADFLRHFPGYDAGRVRVLPLGADVAVSTRPEHDQFASALFDGEPYAVYCATLDRRKNHQVLYRAVKEMTRRGNSANVAFVGMLGNGANDLIDSLRHDPLVAGRFAHITKCDDAHLAAIYRRAKFAVYPSLYEGWGLGVTEALAHGTPCLIATGSSLAEAGLGFCRELHPLRTEEWVDAMTAYFDSPPEVPPFLVPTWDAAAKALLEMVQP